MSDIESRIAYTDGYLERYRNNLSDVTYVNVRNDFIDYFGAEFAVFYAKLCKHMIHIAYLENVNFTGWFYYTVSWIAENSGLGKRSVLNYLKLFSELKLIYKTKFEQDSRTWYYIPSINIVENKQEECIEITSEDFDGRLHVVQYTSKRIRQVLAKETNISAQISNGGSAMNCTRGSAMNCTRGSAMNCTPYIKINSKIKTKEIKTKSFRTQPAVDVPSDGKVYVSKRRSIPKSETRTLPKLIENDTTRVTKISRSRKKFIPSERERQFSEMLWNKIKKNFPNAVSGNNLEQKITSGAEVIHKLVHKHGFEFKHVKQVLLWALTDTFWKMQFRSLSGLLTVSKRNGLMKFENMAMSFQQDTVTEEEQIEIEIDNYLEGLIHENDLKKEKKNVDIFRKRLETVNRTLSNKNKFDWHNGMKLLPVIKWIFEYVDEVLIEQRDVHTWLDLVTLYLQFLHNKLRDNSIETIHAGMFSTESALFKRFVFDFEDQRETELIKKRNSY